MNEWRQVFAALLLQQTTKIWYMLRNKWKESLKHEYYRFNHEVPPAMEGFRTCLAVFLEYLKNELFRARHLSYHS